MPGTRNRSGYSFLLIITLLLGAMFISGCGQGLPKHIKARAKALPDEISAAVKTIDQDKAKYNAFAKSPGFSPVKRFAAAENWPQKFDLARQEVTRARDLYQKNLKPLVSKNRPEAAAQVQKEISRIKTVLWEAKNLSGYPLSRSAAILKTIETVSEVKSRAQDTAVNISRIAESITSGPIEKALADFPDAAAKIREKAAPFSSIDRQAASDLDIILLEYKTRTGGGDADYAAITDKAAALAENLKKITALEKKTTAEIEGLYKSYSKILKDMKVTYQVTVKRESWDENSDFYNPKFATFTREVPEEVYEAVTADNVDTIARVTPGFYGSRPRLSVNINGNMWKQLAINPVEQWPSRYHNAASFWVENAKENYFHKYLLEEDGQTSETGWQPVSETMYDANMEYLGMAILSKPFGVFEQDVLKQAAPPGMAYVGNPKYGEWKEGNNGDRFWSWYGRYAFFSTLFFFPPYYYPYSSWHGWHANYRNKRPYFGRTQKGFQQFGTGGSFVRRSPGFQNTTFAQSGGFKSQTASVRGAGPGLRGGGPKTKGK